MSTFQSPSLPLPIYQQIADQLRRQIKDGHIKPGDRLPSITEMRAVHGISRPNMDKVHSILEHEGLVMRRQGTGTFVLEITRRKTRGVLGVRGLGFPFADRSPYWGPMMAGIRAGATRAGFDVLLLDHASHNAQQTDGLLLAEGTSQDTIKYAPRDLPCVSLLVPAEGIASVYADDYAGGRQATDHLLKLGHRRIGYLHVETDAPDMVTRRLSGYRDALRAAGIAVSKDWERVLPAIRHDIFDPADDLQFVRAGRETMTCWLESDWKASGLTALLAQNDYMAIGAMEAIRECGLSTPEDISVVGFDGLQIGQFVSPRLTTIEVPLHAIGEQAVEILCAQIESGQTSAEHRLLPTRVLQGRSCGAHLSGKTNVQASRAEYSAVLVGS